LVIDTGVFVEFLCATPHGNAFDTYFLSNQDFQFYYMSPLAYTELLYIFCRKMGMDQADQLLADKLKHIIVLDEEKLRHDAALLKCRFGIALSDCYSIAAGKVQNCPVLLKKEHELNEIDLSKFPAQVLFIDDYSEIRS